MKSIFYFKSKYLRDIIDYTKDLCNIPYHTKLSEFNPYLLQYSYDESLTCQFLESAYLSTTLIDTNNSIYEIAPYLFTRNYNVITRALTVSLPVCKKIGSYAFKGSNYGTITLNLPNCEYFGEGCFYDRDMYGSISFSKCSYIGNSAFQGIKFPSSTNLVLSASYIGSSAFQDTSNIDTITFLQSNVNESTFYNCHCSTFNFTASELNIVSSYAFNWCWMSSINVSKIYSVGTCAFGNCFNLQKIPEEINYIGANAFSSCSKLSEINLQNCSLVGYGAFEYCRTLSTVSISGVYSVEKYAFYSCSQLSSVTLNGCSQIGSYAFQSCYSLSNITLNGCTQIDLSAFYPWTNTSVRSFYLLGSSVISLNAYYATSIFSRIGSTTFYVPSSMLSLYQSALRWSGIASRFSVMED